MTQPYTPPASSYEAPAEVVQLTDASGYGSGAVRDASGKVYVPTADGGAQRYVEAGESAWSWLSKKVSGSPTTPTPSTPPARTTSAAVVSSVTPAQDKAPVSVSTPAQAVAVVKANAPSLPPTQQQQAASVVLQQAQSGRTIYVKRRGAGGSFSTPLLIGLGVAGVVGVTIVMASLRD